MEVQRSRLLTMTECTVNRPRSNTPLQSLVLFNDPQFVEAARVLAENVMREEADKSAQIILAYRRLTGLTPRSAVVTILTELAIREQQKFALYPGRARELLGVGEFPVNDHLPPAELAAMTLVGSTIMGFDETLVKR